MSASSSTNSSPPRRPSSTTPTPPTPPRRPCTTRGPPQLSLHVPEGRDYGWLLRQTTTVYNRLLSDKYDKLLYNILERKRAYDETCDAMVRENETKALEYAVRAQDQLLKLQAEANRELGYLHMDYQAKLQAMNKQLEHTWKTEKLQKPKVHFKLLPHKKQDG